MKTPLYVCEVNIPDPDAQELAPYFLPEPGSYVTNEELKLACDKLAEATRAIKALRRAGKLQ